MDRPAYSKLLKRSRSQPGSTSPKIWVYAIVCHFFREAFIEVWRGRVRGLEHIPQKGPFLLAGNHVSFLDPPLFGSFLPRHIFYFARDTLFKPGFMNWLMGALYCIPIKRESKGDVGAIKKVLKTLNEGHGLLVFPEGSRSPDGRLQAARPGLGMIACKTRVPIVPAYINGTFQALGRHKRMLSFKDPIHVTYGPPLYAQDYDPGADHPKRYQVVMDRVMERIRELSPEA